MSETDFFNKLEQGSEPVIEAKEATTFDGPPKVKAGRPRKPRPAAAQGPEAVAPSPVAPVKDDLPWGGKAKAKGRPAKARKAKSKGGRPKARKPKARKAKGRPAKARQVLPPNVLKTLIARALGAIRPKAKGKGKKGRK